MPNLCRSAVTLLAIALVPLWTRIGRWRRRWVASLPLQSLHLRISPPLSLSHQVIPSMTHWWTVRLTIGCLVPAMAIFVSSPFLNWTTYAVSSMVTSVMWWSPHREVYKSTGLRGSGNHHLCTTLSCHLSRPSVRPLVR